MSNHLRKCQKTTATNQPTSCFKSLIDVVSKGKGEVNTQSSKSIWNSFMVSTVLSSLQLLFITSTSLMRHIMSRKRTKPGTDFQEKQRVRQVISSFIFAQWFVSTRMKRKKSLWISAGFSSRSVRALESSICFPIILLSSRSSKAESRFHPGSHLQATWRARYLMKRSFNSRDRSCGLKMILSTSCAILVLSTSSQWRIWSFWDCGISIRLRARLISGYCYIIDMQMIRKHTLKSIASLRSGIGCCLTQSIITLKIWVVWDTWLAKERSKAISSLIQK